MPLPRPTVHRLLAGAALALISGGSAFAALDLPGRDVSVKPGDDFFVYANGAWDKATAIPEDHASWGAGQVVAERVDKQVADLIKDLAASSPAPGSEAAKIAAFYGAYMDGGGSKRSA